MTCRCRTPAGHAGARKRARSSRRGPCTPSRRPARKTGSPPVRCSPLRRPACRKLRAATAGAAGLCVGTRDEGGGGAEDEACGRRDRCAPATEANAHTRPAAATPLHSPAQPGARSARRKGHQRPGHRRSRCASRSSADSSWSEALMSAAPPWLAMATPSSGETSAALLPSPSSLRGRGRVQRAACSLQCKGQRCALHGRPPGGVARPTPYTRCAARRVSHTSPAVAHARCPSQIPGGGAPLGRGAPRRCHRSAGPPSWPRARERACARPRRACRSARRWPSAAAAPGGGYRRTCLRTQRAPGLDRASPAELSLSCLTICPVCCVLMLCLRSKLQSMILLKQRTPQLAERSKQQRATSVSRASSRRCMSVP
jgi:hypothetical protein